MFELEAIGCRSALTDFWNHVTAIETIDSGLVLSLPLLMSDGWQVSIYINNEKNGYVSLRDMGQMDSWLRGHGVDIDRAGVIANERKTLMQKFQIFEDERGYFKMFPLPLDAKEIQLFGEFIVSLSYLVYKSRRDKSGAFRQAYQSVASLAFRLPCKCTQNRRYKTPYREINVDFSLMFTSKDALIQTFDQMSSAQDSMELWSARLREIADYASNDREMKTIMVYNEDVCNLKSDVIKVAEGRGNFVVPSHRSDELESYIMDGVAC